MIPAVLPLLIRSSNGTARIIVAMVRPMYTGRRPIRSPSRPISGTVAKPSTEPQTIAVVGTERSTRRSVAM